MLPLFNPQVGCVGVAAAVMPVELFNVTDADEVQPPAPVTVTV
jgi:hypothetical protein